MRKRREQLVFGLETVSGRIRWLCGHLWSGSQTNMARDLGVTQGAISHVLTGRRKPGRDLLAAIAKHRAINPAWLLTGEGDALLSDVLLPACGEAALPVARQLFEGCPEQHPDKLEPHLLAVTRRLYRPSRYWIVVGPGHPLTRDPRIAVGDSVLFEPDYSGWLSDIRGRPCIVRVGRSKGAKLQFARSRTCTSRKGTTDEFSWYSCGPLAQSQDADHGETRRQQRSMVLPDMPLVPVPVRQKKQTVTLIAVGVYRCGGFASSKDS